MAFAFDSLAYAKKLTAAGIPQTQAEAHAEAAREFIMAELVTKADLQVQTTYFDAKLDTLSLRITVRLGAMLAAGIGILALVVKLH